LKNKKKKGIFLRRKFYRIKKLVQIMNRNVGIATAVGIAIIIGVIGFQINDTVYYVSTPEEYKKSMGTQSVAHVVYPDNPQLLGPLQINKDKYLLGENIFAVLKGLKPNDVGSILFITPGGTIYDEWGFNGNERDFQKKYFKPQLLKSKSLCEKEMLIGEWTVMFKGYDMAVLNFEMLPEILPNQEHQFVDCAVAYEIDIKNP
tara:strand:+ start:123 stop:731 length:609 start_codon:yes stop_codon:yes gene_type:complete